MKRPEDLQGETVLYGCLNWGSGHIARSVPLMQQLIAQGNKLVLWCTSEQRKIAEIYGIQAQFVEEDFFTFRFRGDGNFTREMLRNILGFRRAVLQQRRLTEIMVKQFGITAIVSDHCYGLVHTSVPSFFVTHQVKLPGKSGGLAQVVHRKWMNRFQTIWIMDDANNRLAGALSADHPKGCYIGHYSRFSGKSSFNGGGLVAIISGPEPYAQQLFQLIVQQSEEQQIPITIISPRTYVQSIPENIRVITDNWLAADDAIRSADNLLSRNGYSTLMDLLFLEKQAILIPTKGQTEQEYLATVNRQPNWKILPSDTNKLPFFS